MPFRPVLMVLYTNDAVEVRYSDGSRLHILPCGTSFSYHSDQEAHPVHGMKSVQQRCPYVTSLYRGLVLPAIDFRNRFAERPYICRELQEQDQIIDLYAKITEVGWPKQATNQNSEVLEGGSVRITSEDEFGSLILSPHRKDFTVCYLSSLSQEKRRDRQNKGKSFPAGSQRVGQKVSNDKIEQSKHVLENVRAQTPENVDHFSFHRDGMPDGKMGDDLNLSPITQASCTDSPQAMSTASGSPITPLDALKYGDAKFRPFSTPTQELDHDEPICPYGSTAVFRQYQKSRPETDNKNGSYLEEKPTVEIPIRRREALTRSVEKSFKLEHDETLVKLQSRSDKQDTSVGSEGSNSSAKSCDQTGAESKSKCSYCWVTRHMSCEECPVTWSHVLKMAQAVAEDRCPILDTGQGLSRDKMKLVDSSHLRKIKKDQCVFSSLPQPLPLSCPGQHLHKTQARKVYQDDKDPMEDPSTFSQGHLKVLLVDGIIYRIVRHTSIKVVEVYPGDGSVLVSQGMSAHFFQHIIPHGNKLEERTYSMKSPPQTSSADYSIKSLISRASRFLAYTRQEDSTTQASARLCCWKHEEMAILEPMSTTVLEECTIPGQGKFTALSNGQVRIAFQDRTCLDMTCDFSVRIHSCMEHSSGGSVQMPVPDKKAGTCRLLLPNGQYQMVDVKQPGIYKCSRISWRKDTIALAAEPLVRWDLSINYVSSRYKELDKTVSWYIDIAREWADWVNSSPTQRATFYRNKNHEKNMNQSVERELQRIQCFNYLVDNVVLKKMEGRSGLTDPGSSGAFRPYNKQAGRPGPSILRNSNAHRPTESYDVAPIRSVQINSPPRLLVGSLANQISNNTSSLSSHSVKSSLIGQPWKVSDPLRQSFTGGQRSVSKKEHSLEGFDEVRQALLRTSSVINDIDQILGKN